MSIPLKTNNKQNVFFVLVSKAL